MSATSFCTSPATVPPNPSASSPTATSSSASSASGSIPPSSPSETSSKRRCTPPWYDEDVDVVISRMRVLGIRRVPVVDAHGHLAGIFTMDDYLRYLGRQLQSLTDLVQNERTREQDSRVVITYAAASGALTSIRVPLPRAD
jgi:hypothetical protein